MINCPICDEAMKHQTLHGVQIDVCGKHGIWLDKTELLSVTEGARHDAPVVAWDDFFRREQRPPVDRQRTLSCPHCHTDMALEMYEAVTMDWCRDHGVWLDNGELDAILNNLRLDPLYVRRAALRLWENKY